MAWDMKKNQIGCKRDKGLKEKLKKEKGKGMKNEDWISGAWNLINKSSSFKSIKTSSQIFDLWPLCIGCENNQNWILH